MDGLIALDRAGHDFLRRAEQITDDQWSVPNVCGHWTTKKLMTHMISGCLMTSALLRGATREEVNELASVEAGDDAVERLAEALADHLAAFSQPGVLDRELDHPNGPMLARYLLGYRTIDLAAHAWDLSRALGFDEQLDPEAVAFCWTFLQPLTPVIAGIGLFGDGPSGTVPESAPLQDRMLDFTGRRLSAV
jgi:uncharacterized protein (TIGR03086 family)